MGRNRVDECQELVVLLGCEGKTPTWAANTYVVVVLHDSGYSFSIVRLASLFSVAVENNSLKWKRRMLRWLGKLIMVNICGRQLIRCGLESRCCFPSPSKVNTNPKRLKPKINP
ncbi:hypothetical protein AKJ16_DCAP18887 [Drosera capensis]